MTQLRVGFSSEFRGCNLQREEKVEAVALDLEQRSIQNWDRHMILFVLHPPSHQCSASVVSFDVLVLAIALLVVALRCRFWPSPSPSQVRSLSPVSSFQKSASILRPSSKFELGFKGMSYRAKSTGNGDSSNSSDRVCKCGMIAHLKVSNSEANPGREYYSCPEGKCRWFRWAGPPMKCPVIVGAQNRERVLLSKH
ncbi:hypothetical protein PIB30_061159 [Stylosanthes scabra]|uniref:GRF-type domain-containing protein n=1 Tax=Stylosanthes scabra TaxID=79078 RepID=A0ABU6XM65_9FABA|nr:hypothetical protein [Stylosanthes scabra]